MSSAASVNYICITDLVYNSLTLHSQVEGNWKMDIINSAAEFIQKNSSKKHEIVLRKCIKTFLIYLLVIRVYSLVLRIY